MAHPSPRSKPRSPRARVARRHPRKPTPNRSKKPLPRSEKKPRERPWSHPKIGKQWKRFKAKLREWYGEKIPEYQKHHLIPTEHRNHRAIRIAGINPGSHANRVLLPAEAPQAARDGRNVHSGSHPRYNKAIGNKLDRFLREYDSGKINKSQLRDRLERLQRRLRKTLKNENGERRIRELARERQAGKISGQEFVRKAERIRRAVLRQRGGVPRRVS